MKKTVALVVLAVMASCHSTKKDERAEDGNRISQDTTTRNYPDRDSINDPFQDIGAYQVTSPVNQAEIQTVDSTKAIFIDPSEEQIAKMTKEYGEEDFYTVADDASFYHYSARLVLDSAGIKTVTGEKRYLKLIGDSKTWLLDIRQDGAPEWNIIFFNKTKDPMIISAIDVDQREVRQYFNEK